MSISRSLLKMSKTFLFCFCEIYLHMETFRMKKVKKKKMSRLTQTSLKFPLLISYVETNRWISWSHRSEWVVGVQLKATICLCWFTTYFHVTSTSIQCVIHCIFTDFTHQKNDNIHIDVKESEIITLVIREMRCSVECF